MSSSPQPRATSPDSSWAARPATGSVAPTERASSRAIARSLRWSEVRNPSGYSLSIIRPLRFSSTQLRAAPPPSAAATASASRPALSASTIPSATPR